MRRSGCRPAAATSRSCATPTPAPPPTRAAPCSTSWTARTGRAPAAAGWDIDATRSPAGSPTRWGEAFPAALRRGGRAPPGRGARAARMPSGAAPVRCRGPGRRPRRAGRTCPPGPPGTGLGRSAPGDDREGPRPRAPRAGGAHGNGRSCIAADRRTGSRSFRRGRRPPPGTPHARSWNRRLAFRAADAPPAPGRGPRPSGRNDPARRGPGDPRWSGHLPCRPASP